MPMALWPLGPARIGIEYISTVRFVLLCVAACTTVLRGNYINGMSMGDSPYYVIANSYCVLSLCLGGLGPGGLPLVHYVNKHSYLQMLLLLLLLCCSCFSSCLLCLLVLFLHCCTAVVAAALVRFISLPAPGVLAPRSSWRSYDAPLSAS